MNKDLLTLLLLLGISYSLKYFDFINQKYFLASRLNKAKFKSYSRHLKYKNHPNLKKLSNIALIKYILYRNVEFQFLLDLNRIHLLN